MVVNNVRKTNGIGTAGFVLAILSLCLSWTPLAGFFVWFLGFLLSFIGMFKSPRGLAVAGFIISIAGFLVLCICRKQTYSECNSRDVESCVHYDFYIYFLVCSLN